MSRRVVVLGADGFIGSHVLSALAACDWAAPVAAGRRAGGGVESPRTERIRVDARNADSLVAALNGSDAVVNCVAGDGATFTEGMRALLSAAQRQVHPPLIIHLSSMAVYGPVTGTVDEDAALAGTDPYARAKIETEQAVRDYKGRWVIFRPGIVYGPRSSQWTTRVAKWLRARRIGDLGAAGDGICNLVHAADLAAAVTRSILTEASSGGVFNLSLSDPPTWNDYLVRFARALGFVPAARVGRRWLKLETRLLAPPLKIAEIIGRKAGLGSRLPEPIPPSFLRLTAQEIRLDVARAEKALALRWTPLDEGLRQSAQWFRQSAT